MAINIEDIYRRLSVLLLTAPRHPLGEENPSFRFSFDLLKSAGVTPTESPVNGVALGIEEDGVPAITLLLREDFPEFSLAISGLLELTEFRIRQLVIGETTLNNRPALGGESLGAGATHGESGTFGCLVEDAARDQYILSCHHVLSPLNGGRAGLDPIWQPSSKDGGTSTDEIGVLYAFAPIVFGGFVPNDFDAALAKPTAYSDVTSGLLSLGYVSGTCSSLPYRTAVEKYGWRTKHTKGTFLFKTSYLQHYPGHGDALFRDQLGIVGWTSAFSKGGDSGSLVINGSREAVGLVFAEASDIDMTFANPIDKIFNYFGVTPV